MPAKAKELIFQKRFLPTFGEYTSPPSVASPACACQGQRTYFPKTLSADVRRVHFSTVGDRPRRAPAKAKELFFQKTLSAERPASTLLHRRRPPRRELAKAKELIYQKSGSRRLPCENRKKHFNQHTGICSNTPISPQIPLVVEQILLRHACVGAQRLGGEALAEVARDYTLYPYVNGKRVEPPEAE